MAGLAAEAEVAATVAFLALLVLCVGVAWSVAWPIPGLPRISHITHIKFPAGSVLTAGYDWNCGASELLGAKVRMPRSEVSAFLASGNMGDRTETYDGRVDPARYPELIGHGWDLARVRHFREATFFDSSFTQVLVDLDDPRSATVYIDYDEP